MYEIFNQLDTIYNKRLYESKEISPEAYLNTIRELYKSGIISKSILMDILSTVFVNIGVKISDVISETEVDKYNGERVKYVDHYIYQSLNYELDIPKFIMDNIKVNDRYILENNPFAKQIIPYMMIIHNGKLVLLYKNKGTDDRVVGQYDFPSGHMDEKDDTIEDTIYRELNEELGLNREDINSIDYIDYIPDVFSSLAHRVSSYHLGLIYKINLKDNTKLINKEDSKHQLVYFEDIDFTDKDVFKLFGNWCVSGINKYLSLQKK